jgi:GTP-binding protein
LQYRARKYLIRRKWMAKVHEPFEEVIVDVHEDYSNKVIDNLQKRKGIMTSMVKEGENNRISFRVPSRGFHRFQK